MRNIALYYHIVYRRKQGQIQVKVSTIFKKKMMDTPQTFGFYESSVQKYCSLGVALSKPFGYVLGALSPIPFEITPVFPIPVRFLDQL